MNQTFINSTKEEPKFNPVKTLEQFSNAWANGYLKVSSNSIEWKIYLNNGKLVYATHSLDPFDRLERHLRRLSQGLPILTSTVRQQARLNFESELQHESLAPSDYRAIEWLVEQNYINVPTADKLVNDLNKEVFESYLLLKNGNSKFISNTLELPQFFNCDLKTFIEDCHKQLQAWQALASLISSPEQRPYFLSQAAAAETISPEQLEKLSKLLRGFSFRQLAVLTNQDEIKIAKRLYALIKNKTVILRPPQPPFDRLPVISAPATVDTTETQPNLAVAPRTSTQTQINPKETISSIAIAETSQKQHTIVCVDDSPTILKEINRFLGEYDLKVHAIANPTKALMEITRIKPDMVLLDVGMPTIDGYKLCRLLRNHSLFHDTPIVMVTGNSGLIDRAKARVAGATDYLTKPFTQNELVKMVFRYLT
ncbi:MAG: response regulator [Hydrococcus sp. Prado102]|jgi:twitching motility two-component system response regulator PilG|nr:response regulator [Hydrococcus sp. Prado102]